MGGRQGKLLSPARRRAAVEKVRRTLLEVSKRMACRVLGQPRAVQQYMAQVRDNEAPLNGRIIKLSSVYERYGSPRITGMLRAERKDYVWAYDFVAARTHGGQPFRLTVVMDELTRECLLTDVVENLCSDDVLERLSWLMATRGVPNQVRSDNGVNSPRRRCGSGSGRSG